MNYLFTRRIFSRRLLFIIIALIAIPVTLLLSQRRQDIRKRAAETSLYAAHFSSDTNGWENFTEKNGLGNSLAWIATGGKQAGYIASLGPWWLDPNHRPPNGAGYLNLVAFTFTSRITSKIPTSKIDFRDAAMSFSVKGEQVDLRGSHLVFWVQSYSPSIKRFVNYAYTGNPLDQYLRNQWQDVSFMLVNDPNQWTCLNAAPDRAWLYGCSSLNEALSDVNRDFGFILLPVQPSQPPTGNISFDEITLSYKEIPRSVLPTLTVSPQISYPGGTLTIQWENIPVPVPSDKIALYKEGAADNQPITSFYTSSCAGYQADKYLASGSCSFTIPASFSFGTYVFRLWAENAYSTQYANTSILLGAQPSSTPIPTPTPTIVYPPGLISYWKLEEQSDLATRDSVGTNHGVLKGTTATTGYQGGYARQFNGSSAYISLAKPASLLLSGNETVILWAKLNNFNNFPYLYADFDPTGNQSQGSLRVGYTGNKLGYYHKHTDGTSLNFDGDPILSPNTWYQLAFVRDDAAKTVQLYINGQAYGPDKSYAGKTIIPPDSIGEKTIGRAGSFKGNYVNGVIDEVQVYNRALSASEIQERYTTPNIPIVPTPTLPVLPGIVSFWNLEESAGSIALDVSDGNHGLINGTTVVSRKNGNAARQFNGISDVIRLGKPQSLNLNGSATVALWMNVSNSTFNPYSYVYGDFDVGGIRTQGSLRVGYTGPKLGYAHYNTDGTLLNFDGDPILTAYTWYHIAFVRDDAAKTVQLYLNGQPYGTARSYAGKTVISQEDIANPEKALGKAGNFQGSPGNYFQGSIDDVQMYKRALSFSEIQTLYNASL